MTVYDSGPARNPEPRGRVYLSEGTPTPLRGVEVVPEASGGRIDSLWTDDAGSLLAGVVFPDGHVEVHQVELPAGGDTQ